MLKRELNDLNAEFDETSRFLHILQVLHPETTSVVRQFILQQHHRLEYASNLRKEYEREQRKMLTKLRPVQKQQKPETQQQQPQPHPQPQLQQQQQQPQPPPQSAVIQTDTKAQSQPQPQLQQQQQQPQQSQQQQQQQQRQQEEYNHDKSMEMLKELGFTDEEVNSIF